MADFVIEKDTFGDLLKQHGSSGLTGILNAAKEAINTGDRVIVQRSFTNAPPEVEVRIRSMDDLYNWIVENIKPQCPVCGKALKQMAGGEIRNRYKCYDPPGCGAIFRLSSDIPPRWMMFNDKGGPETPHPIDLV